jgi:hypothetical protein
MLDAGWSRVQGQGTEQMVGSEEVKGEGMNPKIQAPNNK